MVHDELTIKDILRSNVDKRDDTLLRWVLRPVGEYISWIAIKVNVPVMAITYVNFLNCLVVFFVFVFGGPALRMAAVALLILWQLIDTVDGTVARTLKVRNNYGGYIDQITGIYLLAFLDFCVAVNTYSYPDHSIQQLFKLLDLNMKFATVNFLIFGSLSSIIAVLVRLLLKIEHERFGLQMPLKIGDVHFFSIGNLVKQFEHLGGFKIIILLIAVFFRRLELYVVFYFVLYFILFVAMMFRSVFKFRYVQGYNKDTAAGA